MTRHFSILGSVAFATSALVVAACGGGELESEAGGSSTAGAAGSNVGKAGSAGASGAQGGSTAAGSGGGAGKAGTSGTSGSSGASGASGKAGAGGSSGASGKAGAGGSSGASGKAGGGGSSGASGKAGGGGASGSSGAAGKAGSGGASGQGGAGQAGAAGQGGAGQAGAAGQGGGAGSGGAAPSCNDNLKNQDETDVDCGGKSCGTCPDGDDCATNTDCTSQSCDVGTGKCVPAVSCTNSVKDGAETDVDCGGGTCKACVVDQTCVVAADCDSGVCDGTTKKCLAATCTDGVRNGAETDTDCGGGTCKTCDVGGGCKTGSDCTSGICDAATSLCVAAPTCSDLSKNGSETDVDCGGGSCPTCVAGQGCLTGTDCDSGLCDAGTGLCLPPPTCFDTAKNQDETGVDCGGATCAKRCATSEPCLMGSDCDSGVCDPGTNTCAAPACPDTVQNGTETDVDCGGPACAKCDVGKKCLVATDCSSAICDPGTGTCAPGQCGDGIVSAGEGCDLGPSNSTLPGFVYFQGATRFSPVPFYGAATAAGFYSYGNPNGSSGNTGNEATDTCFMYLYRQTTTGTLSLIMHCGKKSAQAAAKANLDCTGVAAASTVTVSDDNGELTKPTATTLRGRWTFNANTDGGVLTGVDFPGTNATMTCTWSGLTGLPNGVVWLNADGTKTPITQGSSFDLTINATGSACRTNCTVPTCNDGVLDAGEMCDDGDPVAGVCPANCQLP